MNSYTKTNHVTENKPIRCEKELITNAYIMRCKSIRKLFAIPKVDQQTLPAGGVK